MPRNRFKSPTSISSKVYDRHNIVNVKEDNDAVLNSNAGPLWYPPEIHPSERISEF